MNDTKDQLLRLQTHVKELKRQRRELNCQIKNLEWAVSCLQQELVTEKNQNG